MATETMNTAVPAASGTAEYDKYLRDAYGIQSSTAKGVNSKNKSSGRSGGSSGNNGSTNAYINQMYDSSLESQKQQLQSNYETDISNLDAERTESQRKNEEDLARTYVEAYKKAKNFNEVQNAYGLTSGAMGQASLASGNQMQADMTNLRATQEQIEAEIERQRSILGKEYSAAIAKAQADNDFQRAQALYEQAQKEEERMLQLKMAAGELMAGVGDYSILGSVYGLSSSQVEKLEEQFNNAAASSGSSGGAGTVSYATWLANLSNSDRKRLEEAGEI